MMQAHHSFDRILPADRERRHKVHDVIRAKFEKLGQDYTRSSASVKLSNAEKYIQAVPIDADPVQWWKKDPVWPVGMSRSDW